MISKKQWMVMGLAMGLPSSIIGLFFLLKILVDKNIISFNMMLIILLMVVFWTLYLMMKYASKKKTQ